MDLLRIKEIRKEKGITLAQLAKAVHTTPVTISRYERGQRKVSILKAAEIADALGVPVGDLIGKAG